LADSRQPAGFLQACKISQLNIGEAVMDGFVQFSWQKKQHHQLAQPALVSEQLENKICSKSDFGQ